MNIEIKKSKRKTLSIEVRPDGRVIVRAPIWTTKRQIDTFIESHKKWLDKALAKNEARQEQLEKIREGSKDSILTSDDIKELAARAKKLIPERVEHYAPLVGVDFGRITIRSQKTRWGSCSTKGNLNFNCLLMLAPLEVLDSVVVHELCHRKEMNHSKRFYAEVLRVYPEYYKWNRWLKTHGSELLLRMRAGEELG